MRALFEGPWRVNYLRSLTSYQKLNTTSWVRAPIHISNAEVPGHIHNMESGNIVATHFNNIANIYKNILENKLRNIKLNRFNLYVFSYTREFFNKKSILCLNKQGQKQIVSSQFVVVKYDTEHR
jgi:hypothetical protein